MVALSKHGAILRTSQISKPLGPGDEGADFFFVIADLEPVVIDDDRTFQYGGIGQNEGTKFGDGHLIEIDVVFQYDFRTAGNDVIGAVFAFGNHFFDVLFGEVGRKDRFGDIGNLILVKPFFDLAARGATGGGVDFNHGKIIACFLKQG